MNFAKYGSRKFHIALLVLAATVWLAYHGKLDAVAAGMLAAVLGLYNHANLKQKREEAESKTDGLVL